MNKKKGISKLKEGTQIATDLVREGAITLESFVTFHKGNGVCFACLTSSPIALKMFVISKRLVLKQFKTCTTSQSNSTIEDPNVMTYNRRPITMTFSSRTLLIFFPITKFIIKSVCLIPIYLNSCL